MFLKILIIWQFKIRKNGYNMIMKNYDLLNGNSDKPHRIIMSIDLKSFYASVECVDRRLDPFVTPLVVVDKSRGPGTIILAVTPYLKEMGIPSRLRLYDLPKIPNLIHATPRMKRYLEVSAQVVGIFLDFACEEDIHVYSIDESFIDLTNYAIVKKIGPKAYAKRIMDAIYKKLGLTVTIGIGENIFMAKAAMDIEAKKSPDFIAQWTYDDIPQKLWPINPLTKMWGIGKRMEKRLNDLGFFRVGDIATSDCDYLKSKFGIIGEEIYNHSHGIDTADIHENYHPADTSLGVGQVLFEDYDFNNGILPILEMGEELTLRLLQSKKLCSRLYLYIGYSKTNGGGASSGYIDFQGPTDDELEIKSGLKDIYYRKVDPNRKIRKISISATGLMSNSNYQMDLFSNPEEVEKKRRLSSVILQIKEKFGTDKVTKCISAYEKSNFKKRHSEIGGHKK